VDGQPVAAVVTIVIRRAGVAVGRAEALFRVYPELLGD